MGTVTKKSEAKYNSRPRDVGLQHDGAGPVLGPDHQHPPPPALHHIRLHGQGDNLVFFLLLHT